MFMTPILLNMTFKSDWREI